MVGSSSSSSSAAAPLLPLHQQQSQQQQSPTRSTVSRASNSDSMRRSRRRPRPLPRRSSSSPLSTLRRQTPPSPVQVQPPPLDRLHSGSAVAGFVVGTTFEAILIGLLAFLQLRGNIPETDPLLAYAILCLVVLLAWSLLFQFVLSQLDALCPPLQKYDPQSNLYGHFNMGLAWGMGLECTLLQFIFSKHHSSVLSSLLVSPSIGIVSLVFGVGCVGMTVMRTYYQQNSSSQNKLFHSSSSSYQRLQDPHNVAGMV
ncbi:expressed unknown protein [Seminavis robusta]|uniref:Uncharacterized protein n=1 Tax=Seminavis robusta TaxID=568900 RepID=A0A9N8EJK7_9STRA|nr:expressed unknown protein [Seminavis robusta]|eukprot:Sro1352_g265320.1 n/a (256) ;mRNA; r:12277-13044